MYSDLPSWPQGPTNRWSIFTLYFLTYFSSKRYALAAALPSPLPPTAIWLLIMEALKQHCKQPSVPSATKPCTMCHPSPCAWQTLTTPLPPLKSPLLPPFRNSFSCLWFPQTVYAALSSLDVASGHLTQDHAPPTLVLPRPTDVHTILRLHSVIWTCFSFLSVWLFQLNLSMALLPPSDMKNPNFLLLLPCCSYASKFTCLKSHQNQALVFRSSPWLPSQAYSGYTDSSSSARHPLQPSLWLHPCFTDWNAWLRQSSIWNRGKINTSSWIVFFFLPMQFWLFLPTNFAAK